MSRDEFVSRAQEDLGAYTSWRIVAQSYVACKSRSGYAYIRSSPDFERCVIIHNGRVLLSLETSRSYRRHSCEKETANSSLRDEVFDAFSGEVGAGLDERESWESESEPSFDDNSGANPDRMQLFLSDDGQKITFQFFSDERRYIYSSGITQECEDGLCDVRYAPVGMRKVLILCDSIYHHLYVLDGQRHESELLSGDFTSDGIYFLSLENSNVRQEDEDCVDVAINGDVVFSAQELQFWNPSGSKDEESRPSNSFVLDPFGRSALFGFWETPRAETFQRLKPVIGLLNLKTGILRRITGYEILDASVGELGDSYRVSAINHEANGELCLLEVPLV